LALDSASSGCHGATARPVVSLSFFSPDKIGAEQILDEVQNLTYNTRMSKQSGSRSPDPKDLAEQLREHGLQVTAQRLAVLRAVSARPHCTADDVADDVRSEIGAISRQAVYDALGILSEKGLIRRIQPAGSPALYEDRVGDNHHHVICRLCGKAVDVDCAVGQTPCLTAADDSGYRIEEAEVIYWGTCPQCLASTGKSVKDRGD
jgi:Fur family ferric uptake transcriptional regulator